MSLLQQIQKSVVDENTDLGTVFLKLQLLAAKLGSEYLEDWVKHESHGYPKDIEVPSYRVADIVYRGAFAGPMGTGFKNAPIPTHLVEKYAGRAWVKYSVRESIAAVDKMLKAEEFGSSGFQIDASNLLLMLQGKIYPNYSCIEITGSLSAVGFYEIRQSVKSKILELTVELEKSVPEALSVTFGTSRSEICESEQVQQITQQVFYGNVGTAITGGAGSKINVEVSANDSLSLVQALIKKGIDEQDAFELSEILASEEPNSTEEPLGEKSARWLAQNIKKAAEGSWNIGVSAATAVITQAALKYYGLD